MTIMQSDFNSRLVSEADSFVWEGIYAEVVVVVLLLLLLQAVLHDTPFFSPFSKWRRLHTPTVSDAAV